ncbi:MAG: hypothetical protein KAH32_01900 [Chlamydiia bacterium]|nr:hypothetical protein [Chlamydiia bacterium]
MTIIDLSNFFEPSSLEYSQDIEQGASQYINNISYIMKASKRYNKHDIKHSFSPSSITISINTPNNDILHDKTFNMEECKRCLLDNASYTKANQIIINNKS